MRMNAEPLYRQRVPTREFQELQTMPYMTRQEKLLPMTQAMNELSPPIPMRTTPPTVR